MDDESKLINNDPAKQGRGEIEALSSTIQALQGLGIESQTRVLAAVATFLGIPHFRQQSDFSQYPTEPNPIGAQSSGRAKFSEDRTASPKDFLFDKSPHTDVDRIACLAYYLTHYRDTPHFKTLDLGKLNTEAAQLKFSNAAYAVENATKAGLLVPASKGAKQLSAIGERYVQALPDRDAARAAIAGTRSKRRFRRREDSSSSDPDSESDETT